MAPPMFPNKAAADTWWAAHPTSPLNPNRQPQGPRGPLTPLKPGQKGYVAPKRTKTGTGNKNPGYSFYQKWLNSQSPAGPTPSMTVNPLQGMPADQTLDPYPVLGSLNDGSNVQDTKSPTFNPGRASLINPNDYAKLTGAQSYAPVIQALMLEKQRLAGGRDTALGMIDKNYGDAAAQDQAGAARLASGTAQTNQGLTDLAARMAMAAGGDPTAAAAVGKSSADAQAMNAQFSQIAQGGQADAAAAAQRDAATAKLAYMGENDNRQSDLANKIGAAKTEGQQAQGKAIMDALGFNDQMKTSQLGRDQAKQSAWLSAALAGPEITKANLGNEGLRQGLQLNAHNAEVNDWTTLTSAKQTQYQQRWSKYLGKVQAGQIVDEFKKGNVPPADMALADSGARAAVAQDVMGAITTNGIPNQNPRQTWNLINTTLRREYGTSSRKTRDILAKQFMSQALSKWNGAVANKTHKWVMNPKGVPTLVKR